MLRITIITAITCLTVGISASSASGPVPDEETVETTEVKTRKTKKRDHDSLRFLRDNRDFLRAQLDRLRLETRFERRGAAEDLDPRYLRLQEMAAAIAAARDTVDHQGADLERRQLMQSVSELRDLEWQLDVMDSLLTDQGARLTWVEEDFLGRQETALVVLVKGADEKPAPTGLIISDGEETLTVVLDETQRLSLARGGLVQIDHRLVEPRAHTLAVSLTGPGWENHGESVIQIDAVRDRMTFLELDLSSLDTQQPTVALGVDVWQR